MPSQIAQPLNGSLHPINFTNKFARPQGIILRQLFVLKKQLGGGPMHNARGGDYGVESKQPLAHVKLIRKHT